MSVKLKMIFCVDQIWWKNTRFRQKKGAFPLFSFFRSPTRNACLYLKNPELWGVQLLDPWRLLHFLLFSFLCLLKLTPASCHAKCEFFLKRRDVREILDFSDITRLRKSWPGFFNSLPARYNGSPVWVLFFCVSLFAFIFLQYSRWYFAASSHVGRE